VLSTHESPFSPIFFMHLGLINKKSNRLKIAVKATQHGAGGRHVQQRPHPKDGKVFAAKLFAANAVSGTLLRAAVQAAGWRMIKQGRKRMLVKREKQKRRGWHHQDGSSKLKPFSAARALQQLLSSSRVCCPPHAGGSIGSSGRPAQWLQEKLHA